MGLVVSLRRLLGNARLFLMKRLMDSAKSPSLQVSAIQHDLVLRALISSFETISLSLVISTTIISSGSPVRSRGNRLKHGSDTSSLTRVTCRVMRAGLPNRASRNSNFRRPFTIIINGHHIAMTNNGPHAYAAAHLPRRVF